MVATGTFCIIMANLTGFAGKYILARNGYKVRWWDHWGDFTHFIELTQKADGKKRKVCLFIQYSTVFLFIIGVILFFLGIRGE